jgi:hypothetical protein
MTRVDDTRGRRPRDIPNDELERGRLFVRSASGAELDVLWVELGRGWPRYATWRTWAARGIVAQEMRRRREAAA